MLWLHLMHSFQGLRRSVTKLSRSLRGGMCADPDHLWLELIYLLMYVSRARMHIHLL